MKVLEAAFGLLLVCVVLGEAFETMLLPRRIRRPFRFIALYFRITWGSWAIVGRRLRPGTIKDGFLSVYGPLSVVLLLAFWVAGLILGFGIFQWAVQSGMPKSPGLGGTIYLSAASLFTADSVDIHPLTRLAKSTAVFEGGAGLAFMTVTIGYLPVLYQLFSRREALIIQLDARAGSPPTAAALLCRHARTQAMDQLGQLLRDWEQWCAELIESHLSYPMLSYYRSQHDNQSWLAALAALMDTSALLLAGFKGVRTFSARMTFSMGRLALEEICRAFHENPATSPPDRLSQADFITLERSLAQGGLVFSNSDGNPREKLNALRSTYEPVLFALSDHFLLPLPGWLPDESPDNSDQDPGGSRASELVDSAPAQPE